MLILKYRGLMFILFIYLFLLMGLVWLNFMNAGSRKTSPTYAMLLNKYKLYNVLSLINWSNGQKVWVKLGHNTTDLYHGCSNVAMHIMNVTQW